MAENDVSDGSDFDDVYDDDNNIVLDSDGPGETEDPINRVVGRDMPVNAIFDDEDLSDFEGFDRKQCQLSPGVRTGVPTDSGLARSSHTRGESYRLL